MGQNNFTIGYCAIGLYNVYQKVSHIIQIYSY